VAQLVDALRYKPEGRGFDSRWCHWNPSGRTVALGSTQPLTEMSTRGKGGRCIGLTLPPSCAECLEICEPQPPGTLKACPGLLWDCFTLTIVATESGNILMNTAGLPIGIRTADLPNCHRWSAHYTVNKSCVFSVGNIILR
jgi:hypothetical protein